MFEKFFSKFGSQQIAQEDRFFSEIEGYGDLKEIIAKMLVSKESANVILDGPPASGKTIFLLAIKQNMRNVHYIDGTNASGPGIIEKLFLYPRTQILCIDEIEKMSKRDQNTLLNLLETGILTSTKVRKQVELEFKGIKFFATTNDIDSISKPLRSRLMEFCLPEYTYEEFEKISVKLLAKRNKLNHEIAIKIAEVVWTQMNSKDIRNVLQLGKIVTSINEVEKTARTLMKYSQANRGSEEEE
jgi:replication-associated recombination protein RarA